MRDLAAARLLAEAETPIPDAAIYHCQQAAEKALKGWLQWRDLPFGKTHDLAELIALDAPGAWWADLHESGLILSPYAVAYRYPGGAFAGLPTDEELQDALLAAEKVVVAVTEALAQASDGRDAGRPA